ncbi:type II toxin-antitoxin system VapC family toxin [Caulobacter segnis]|jgi:ribonuclease VapC|uniref:type II toxin-antitoxin system VapC family toxin n=1 Tax=Caulobacter segnis TaxID=88688 RepID=UPI001CBC13F6|nr:type II toxin-antitoxin system VapC family toxin [Caulobacter segnis]UAL11362.1 type II toxin-antitoxin system VapC family toxin [Caulobacter segnis]
MFVDASAWTAIILKEPERERLRTTLADAEVVLTSSIATWETIRAVVRETKDTVKDASIRLAALQANIGARVVEIGVVEGQLALEAHARFGKGVHPARLNMGDCFAYACAKVHGVPLLYKGEDFALTDIEAA